MIRLRHTLGSIVALTLCAVACSSSSLGGETQPLSDAGADSSNGGSGGSGGHSGTGGGSGGGGGSAAGGGSGNGGDAGSSCPDPIAPPVVRLAPGTPTADPNAKGKGACAARSVAQIVSQIHTAHPELADVQAIFDPNVALGDGSFVYAYLTPAGGIDLVFKRGGGDCPAGCTENEY